MATTKNTAPAKEAPKKEAKKVYTFKAENPFLSCASLGVQFVNGVATTEDLAVARALATIDGVELVDD